MTMQSYMSFCGRVKTIGDQRSRGELVGEAAPRAAERGERGDVFLGAGAGPRGGGRRRRLARQLECNRRALVMHVHDMDDELAVVADKCRGLHTGMIAVPTDARAGEADTG